MFGREHRVGRMTLALRNGISDLMRDEELKDNLINAIKRNWARNRIFATQDVLYKLGAEVAPQVPLPVMQVPICKKSG